MPEGTLRCNELKAHLIENHMSDVPVFLSEDASGIVKRVSYDPKTNQLIGIVLPLKENGMPKTLCFKPQSALEIEEFMKLEQSHLVYIVVAQPLVPKSQPFILQIFGTNNKFSRTDVLKRWKYIEQECKSNGINVIGMSADGDPRLLSAMRARMIFDLEELTETKMEICAAEHTHIVFVQDTIHIGTKLRNRLLKRAILMPMGNRLVSVCHLKELLNNTPKNVHLLVRSDICPQDRQNFGSLEKVMDKRVLEALQNNVIDSEGTVMYLRLCYRITSSYLNDELDPVEKIYNIWSAVYFIRAWRKWLVLNDYSSTDNFITSNANQCIEINA